MTRRPHNLEISGQHLEGAWWGPAPDAAPTLVLLHEGRAHVDAPPEQALNEQNIAEVFGVRSRAPQQFFPREFLL